MGLLGIGREVQIGEDHLAASEFASLRRERLLDLHDQFGSLKYSALREVVWVSLAQF